MDSSTGKMSKPFYKKTWFWLLLAVIVVVIFVAILLIVGFATDWFGLTSDDDLPKPDKTMTEVSAAYQDKPENGGFVSAPATPFLAADFIPGDIYARFGYRAVNVPTGATNITPVNDSSIRWNDRVYLVKLQSDPRDNRFTFKIPRPNPDEVKLLATDVRFQLVANYFTDSDADGTKLNTNGVVVHDTIVMDADGVEVTETDNTDPLVTTSSVNPTLTP